MTQHGVVTPRPRKNRAPLFLLIPSIALLLIGTGYPIVWQIITSFRKFGMAQQFGQPAPFVWFENYVVILKDPAMWSVVLRSVLFAVVVGFATVAVGLLVALLMRQVWDWVRVTLQISLLLAWAMPVVAAMTVWIWLFDRRRGVINWLLDSIGLHQFNRFDWLADTGTFFFVAGIVILWMSVPFVALSIYAALTQISEEVLEASELDGAGPVQRLRYIFLPMIRPVIAIVLLLQLVWDLRVFTQIRLLQDAGSSASRFDLIGTAIYKLGTGASDFGMAAALSIFVLLITIGLSSYYVRMLLKEDQ